MPAFLNNALGVGELWAQEWPWFCWLNGRICIRVCRDLKMKVSLAGRRRGGMNRPWKVNEHSKVKLFQNWRSLRLPWNTLVIKTDRTTHFSLCIYIHGLKTACLLIWKSPPRPLKFRFTTCKKTRDALKHPESSCRTAGTMVRCDHHWGGTVWRAVRVPKGGGACSFCRIKNNSDVTALQEGGMAVRNCSDHHVPLMKNERNSSVSPKLVLKVPVHFLFCCGSRFLADRCGSAEAWSAI